MKYAISDIHGCFHTLQNLIKRIRDVDSDPFIVFGGDYVDRGFLNKEVVEYVIDMVKNGKAFAIRGNHDNVIDWILNGKCRGHLENFVRGIPSFDNVIPWWRYNGLNETLSSYGCNFSLIHPNDIAQEFRDKVPQSHKDFFRNLPMFWESDTHFVYHAFYNPAEFLPTSLKFVSSERDDDILWSRFSPWHLSNLTKWNKVGIFGHTPVSYYGSVEPIYNDQIRLIDTGACQNKFLCAYCMDTNSHIMEPTDRRDTDILGF